MNSDSQVSATPAFLGISLSRRYYSKRRIRKYVDWARSNTTRFAFLLGDRIYALTDSVFNNRSEEQSMKLAMQMGDAMRDRIRLVLCSESFIAEIVRWADLEALSEYQDLLSVFQAEYNNPESRFSASIRNEVELNLKRRLTRKLISEFDSEIDQSSWKRLHSYVLREISGLIVMSEYLGYSLEVYPGPDVGVLNQLYNHAFPALTSYLPKNRKRQFETLSFK